MTVRSFGYDGSLDETKWAQLARAIAEVGGYRHGVTSGFDVTAGAGTRQTVVSAGTAVLPGVRADSDANVTLTHDANTGGANRMDQVVLQANWTTNTASLLVVKGSSPTPPALTQTEGNIWQMSLARVPVRPSVTTFLSSDVIPCKPLPRQDYPLFGSLRSTSKTLAGDASPFTLDTINVPDPGWPYRLEFAGEAAFSCSTTGAPRAALIVAVNGNTVARTNTDNFDAAGTRRVANVSTFTTGVYTGTATVTLQMSAVATGSSQSVTFEGDGLNNFFRAQQTPA